MTFIQQNKKTEQLNEKQKIKLRTIQNINEKKCIRV